MKHFKPTPPANARWVMGNRDLPQGYSPFRFEIVKPDGSKSELVFSKRKRQVIEALNIGPVYCASPVRLSDIVGILRNEHNVGIHTEFYDDDSGPIKSRFGVYWLTDKVRFLGEVSDGKPPEETDSGAGHDGPKEVQS